MTSLSQALRHDLREYTLAGIEELLGFDAMAAVRREQRLPALRRARFLSQSSDPDDAARMRLAVLVRLFYLGDSVSRKKAEAALPSVVDAGVMSEVVSETSAQGTDAQVSGVALSAVRARCQIVPQPIPGHVALAEGARRDVLIASDWGELARRQPTDNHVMPVGGATRTLASLAVYLPGQRVLDVGTGCGIHAIIAALAGARVTATDVSNRALEYARLNAELAGVEIDLREGSLLEPAEGLYDVVVSNPPFVITPEAVRSEHSYDYRDGGREGDSLLAELVGGIEEILAPGGRAWLLGNWEIREAWMAGPSSWLTDGLDAWVIQREELSPSQYIEMWLRDGGITVRDPSYEALYAGWLKDFEARKVEAIGMGYLCLGRSHGLPWRRFERIDGPAPADLSEYVEGIWNARPLLMATDNDLSGARLVARGIEHRLHAPGQADPFMIKLAQIGGFASEIQVSGEVAAVVGACDGELSLGTLCDAVAQLMEAGAESVRGEVLPAVREMIAMGMLTPA